MRFSYIIKAISKEKKRDLKPIAFMTQSRQEVNQYRYVWVPFEGQHKITAALVGQLLFY